MRRCLLLRPVLSSRSWRTPARFLSAEAEAEPSPEEKAKIEAFLKRCGQQEHAEKFKSFDQLINSRRLQLKNLQIGTKARKKILREIFKYKLQERWAAGENLWYSVVPSYKLPAGPLFLRSIPHYEGAIPPTGARPRSIKHPDLGWYRKAGFVGTVGDLRKLRDETAADADEAPEIDEIEEGLEESRKEYELRRRAYLLRKAAKEAWERADKAATVSTHLSAIGVEPPAASLEQLAQDALVLRMYEESGTAKYDELKRKEAPVDEREEALAEGDWSLWEQLVEGKEGEQQQQQEEADAQLVDEQTRRENMAVVKSLLSAERAAAAKEAAKKQRKAQNPAMEAEKFWKTGSGN